MKVLSAGHRYILQDFENKDNGQVIQFIEKVRNINLTVKEMAIVNDGTTNEEVIEVLIDRLNYLNAEFPCRENSLAITKLEEALLWLNKRTSDRIKRGVLNNIKLNL